MLQFLFYMPVMLKYAQNYKQSLKLYIIVDVLQLKCFSLWVHYGNDSTAVEIISLATMSIHKHFVQDIFLAITKHIVVILTLHSQVTNLTNMLIHN